MSNPFSTTIGKENGINLLNAHIQWHFGTIAPVTTYPFQNWGDTANDLWKQRNVADTDWIIRGTLSADYFGLTTADLVDPLGTAKEYYGSTLPTKHLWVNGNTIGDASSNATGRANADTEALFTVLWGSVDNTNSQIKLYDSAGVLSAKGASAVADFAAHKKISLPDKRGRTSIGCDTMGGSSANVVTNTNADTLGGFDGEENNTLTIAKIPSHNHKVAGSTSLNTVKGIAESGAASIAAATAGFTAYYNTLNSGTVIIENTGGGEAHNNMQPWASCNFIMRY
jgi:microcystin-dependent protein